MNHFFINPEWVGTDTATIQGSDVNHIVRVLRMREGEELLLSDGAGHDYTCSIAEIHADHIVCSILNHEASNTEPSVKVYLFQGLPKSDKMEFIIQKAVELGVHEIVPVQTARTVVKYDAKKAAQKCERWQKIAESAAKQSRRGIIPQVHPLMHFSEALLYAGDLDLVLIPYENYKDLASTRRVLDGIKPGMRIGVFIGPEGGFEQKEVEAACALKEQQGASANQISLGSRILRTETAPLMLLSVLMFLTEPG